MGIKKGKEPNVEDVAAFAMDLNDRKVAAFTLQREACDDQAKALAAQIEAWDDLLELVSSIPLMKSKLPAFQKLHSGMTVKIGADLKFSFGVAMRIDAELEEFRVVQEGIRGQIEQMKTARELAEQRVATPFARDLKRI